MAKTAIEWATDVWNPITGCTMASAGCQNCYAERFAHRLRGRFGYPADEPFKVTLHPERLEEPLRWRKPRRVFVCSMSDLFHEDVPDEFICRVFVAIALTPVKHTFLILTKRPQRMHEFILGLPQRAQTFRLWVANGGEWPLSNVWLGVTCENQQAADERIPILLQTPAAVRFVSCEPLLKPVNLERYISRCIERRKTVMCEDGYHKVCIGGRAVKENGVVICTCECHGNKQAEKVDWVIVGGETGPNARPMHPDWVRNLRDQCQEAGVPFFLKQLGEWAEIEADAIPRKGKPMCILLNSDGRSRGIEDAPFAEEIGTVVMCRVGKKLAGRLLDGRTWEEFPGLGG